MTRTVISLCLASCMVTSCMTGPSPQRQIEQHLGLSTAGARILKKHLFDPQSAVPDIGYLLHELNAVDQSRNLTLGLLVVPVDDELQLTAHFASSNPASLYRDVFMENSTSDGASLVRPEDVTNIVIETRQWRRIIGTFDFNVPDLISGRCRFVTRGGGLEYLGILRENPIHIYDCFTIFSEYGDMVESSHGIETSYFAVIESASERAATLSWTARRAEIIDLLLAGGLTRIRFECAALSPDGPPLAYVGDREERDRAIVLVEDSEDWRIAFRGRTVATLWEPASSSIKEQLERGANKAAPR
jgi:hypothetical protein